MHANLPVLDLQRRVFAAQSNHDQPELCLSKDGLKAWGTQLTAKDSNPAP